MTIFWIQLRCCNTSFFTSSHIVTAIAYKSHYNNHEWTLKVQTKQTSTVWHCTFDTLSFNPSFRESLENNASDKYYFHNFQTEKIWRLWIDHTAIPSASTSNIPYYHIKQLTPRADRIPSSTAIPFSIVTLTIILDSHPFHLTVLFEVSWALVYSSRIFLSMPQRKSWRHFSHRRDRWLMSRFSKRSTPFWFPHNSLVV